MAVHQPAFSWLCYVDLLGPWFNLILHYICEEFFPFLHCGLRLVTVLLCLLTGAAFNLLVTDQDERNLRKIEQHFNTMISDVSLFFGFPSIYDGHLSACSLP
jgi:hypothetical protein